MRPGFFVNPAKAKGRLCLIAKTPDRRSCANILPFAVDSSGVQSFVLSIRQAKAITFDNQAACCWLFLRPAEPRRALVEKSVHGPTLHAAGLCGSGLSRAGTSALRQPPSQTGSRDRGMISDHRQRPVNFNAPRSSAPACITSARLCWPASAVPSSVP